MKISGIYQIQSKCKPERIYIGSAVNIKKRWGQHLWHLKRNLHHTSKLQRHFNKYGKGDLVFTLLMGCEVDELLPKEQFFLDSLRPWFNTCKMAGGTTGRKFSKETLKFFSKLHKGQRNRKGVTLTEEHKRRISESMKGERNPMFGKPSPKKDKKGHPNPNKGKTGVYSEETLERMRIANKRAWEIRKQNKAA